MEIWAENTKLMPSNSNGIQGYIQVDEKELDSVNTGVELQHLFTRQRD